MMMISDSLTYAGYTFTRTIPVSFFLLPPVLVVISPLNSSNSPLEWRGQPAPGGKFGTPLSLIATPAEPPLPLSGYGGRYLYTPGGVLGVV